MKINAEHLKCLIRRALESQHENLAIDEDMIDIKVVEEVKEWLFGFGYKATYESRLGRVIIRLEYFR
jgi:hypothetical protein